MEPLLILPELLDLQLSITINVAPTNITQTATELKIRVVSNDSTEPVLSPAILSLADNISPIPDNNVNADLGRYLFAKLDLKMRVTHMTM